MDITLRDIDLSNFDACVSMKNQPHVASNVFSIAQSKVDSNLHPMCIYNDGSPVGFVMFGQIDSEVHKDEVMCILRLMVAEEHQNNGYGTEALKRVLGMCKEMGAWKEVYLSTSPENTGAARLYERVGFMKTGEMWGDEEIFCFDLSKSIG